jgi:hydroxymethylpyrimidine pyrophosphatase-like HAD family hydrolase
MQYILQTYKNELSTYKLVENDDILNLPIGCHIIYFSKKILNKKSGTLKSIKDILVLELRYMKKKWYIYTNDNYIFFRERSSKLRNSLQSLLNSDFKISKKTNNKPHVEVIYDKQINKNYLEQNSKIDINAIMENLEKLEEYYSQKK